MTPHDAHLERGSWIDKIGLIPRQVCRHVHFGEPWFALLPAEPVQVVRGGAEHVGHAVDEIALAVAVIVDAVLVVFRRHHLRLAEFAGPGADHVLGPQIAALDQAQRIEKLPAKAVAAPAIVGERGDAR